VPEEREESAPEKLFRQGNREGHRKNIERGTCGWRATSTRGGPPRANAIILRKATRKKGTLQEKVGEREKRGYSFQGREGIFSVRELNLKGVGQYF